MEAPQQRRKGASVRVGGNWKALQKSLLNSSPGDDKPARKKGRHSSSTLHEHTGGPMSQGNKRSGSSRLLSGSVPPNSKGKARQIDVEADPSPASSAVGSPAPTALPWFAEDLSPEDLALVRHIQEGGDATLRTFGSAAVAVASDSMSKKGKAVIKSGASEDATSLLAANAQEAALKKRVILGGWDDNVSEEKKS